MARLYFQLLSLALASGCHEVLALEDPPFARSEAVLLVAEGPSEEALHADTLPLSARPTFVLGVTETIWGFGFGCGLERLGLDRPELSLEPGPSMPTLPFPLETLQWTPSNGWNEALVTRASEEVQRLFPNRDFEPCESYISPPTAMPSRFETFELEEPEEGMPLVQVVPDGRGGLIALQQVRTASGSEKIRSRGRYFRAVPGEESVRPIEITADRPALTIGTRGGTALVLGGSKGFVQGSFESGFSSPLPAGPLAGQAMARMAVSPASMPLEIFTISRDRNPLQGSMAIVTLARTTPAGSEILRQAPVSMRDGRADVPDVVWSGPGEAWAIGFPGSGEIVGVRNGSTFVQIVDPLRAGTLIRIAHRADIGVVVSDFVGRTFLRPPDHPDDEPWIFLGQNSSDRGPIDLFRVDGVPTFAVYRPGPTDRGGGLRFVHVRAPPGENTWCSTEPANIRPLVDNEVSSGLLAGAALDERNWWFLTVSNGRFALTRYRFGGSLGVCTRP